MKSDEIRKLAKKIVSFDGYEYEKTVDIDIKVPSFSVKAKARITKFNNIKDAIDGKPLRVEIDTFQNNIEKVMNEVVPVAIAKSISSKIDDKIDQNSSRVGSWATSFPLSVNFKLK